MPSFQDELKLLITKRIDSPRCKADRIAHADECATVICDLIQALAITITHGVCPLRSMQKEFAQSLHSKLSGASTMLTDETIAEIELECKKRQAAQNN